jgi:hypothetical protein
MEETLKKQEDHRKKQEEMRKKQEEKEEKIKKKDDESRMKEKKVRCTDSVIRMEKLILEDLSSQDQGKQKEAVVSKQASFMANFFKKSNQADCSDSSVTEETSHVSGVEPCEKQEIGNPPRSEKDRDAAVKVHRNFHPWEKPKNAIVAGFPFGPGNIRNDLPILDASYPHSTDLKSWVEHWKKNPRKNQEQRIALRENGSPHPRMKMIQLCMMVPVTKTQLVDVDIEATRKVLWDIEADPEEKQLQSILCEAEPTSDGLFRHEIFLLCTPICSCENSSKRLYMIAGGKIKRSSFSQKEEDGLILGDLRTSERGARNVSPSPVGDRLHVNQSLITTMKAMRTGRVKQATEKSWVLNWKMKMRVMMRWMLMRMEDLLFLTATHQIESFLKAVYRK